MKGDSVVFFVRVGLPGTGKLRIDQSARIRNLEYDDEESKADKLVLEVDNFDLSSIDSPLWRKGNIIEASWGYPGRMSPVRECVIHKIKGARVLKVEALDKGSLWHKRHEIKTWDNAKRSDVARELARKHGFIETTMFVDDTKVVLPHVTQARMTDAQLMNELARREGFVWFVDFDGFHFHERKLAQKPLRTFIYYTDPGQGDIVDWDLEDDVSHQKPGSVKAQGRDPLKKTDIEEKGSNSATQRDGLAGKIDVVDEEDLTEHEEPLVQNTASSQIVPTTEASAETAKRQADGAYKGSQLAAVKLHMVARGDPMMVAKSIVRIERIGPTISGNYYVRSVHHKVGSTSDAYRMEMKLRRDGRNATTISAYEALPGQGDGVSANANVNSQEAKDGGKPGAKDSGKLTPKEKVDPETGLSYQVFVDTAGREVGGESPGASVSQAGSLSSH